MSLTLCVLLWAVSGHEDGLIAYEGQVLRLLGDHEGRLTSRVRAIDPTEDPDGPFEVHTIEFASEAALDGYMNDPARAALADDRDRAIARTQVLRVTTVA